MVIRPISDEIENDDDNPSSNSPVSEKEGIVSGEKISRTQKDVSYSRRW